MESKIPGYLSAKELAKRAGLDDSRIRQLLISGEIKGHKIAGAWLVPAAEAERWLQTRQKTT